MYIKYYDSLCWKVYIYSLLNSESLLGKDFSHENSTRWSDTATPVHRLYPHKLNFGNKGFLGDISLKYHIFCSRITGFYLGLKRGQEEFDLYQSCLWKEKMFCLCQKKKKIKSNEQDLGGGGQTDLSSNSSSYLLCM